MSEQFYEGKPSQIEAKLTLNPPNTVTGVTLKGYKADDTVVSSLNGVTGAFTPTTEAVEIILSYGWTSPVLGHIRLEWLVTFNGGAQETFFQEIEVVAVPPLSRENTYDLATAIGKTRFWANDKDLNDPTWSDAEIQTALDATGASPTSSAIMLLGIKHLEYIEQAVIVKTQTETIDLTKRAEAMQKRITFIVENGPGDAPYTDSPKREFVPEYPEDPHEPYTDRTTTFLGDTNMEHW